MSDSHSGHCLCGGVTYTFEGDPAMVALCHCDDCQRQSGAAFSVNVAVGRDVLTIVDPDELLGTYVTVGTGSGEQRDRVFCTRCGTPIMSVLHEADDLAFLKAGALDEKDWFAPEMEVWTDSAQHWVVAEDGEERGRFPTDIPT